MGEHTLSKRHTILVIDDNEWIRTTLKDLLATSGYQVDIADNGETGLSKVKSKHYDVVLSDVQMPKIDGIATARRIRENH